MTNIPDTSHSPDFQASRDAVREESRRIIEQQRKREAEGFKRRPDRRANTRYSTWFGR